jgi:hypothetical protein
MQKNIYIFIKKSISFYFKYNEVITPNYSLMIYVEIIHLYVNIFSHIILMKRNKSVEINQL